MMAHDRAEAALEAAEAGAVPAYLSGHAGDTASTHTPVLVGPVPYPPSEASREERAAIRKEAFEEAAKVVDSGAYNVTVRNIYGKTPGELVAFEAGVKAAEAGIVTAIRARVDTKPGRE